MKIETPTFHIDVILYTVYRCFRSNLKIGKKYEKFILLSVRNNFDQSSNFIG